MFLFTIDICFAKTYWLLWFPTFLINLKAGWLVYLYLTSQSIAKSKDLLPAMWKTQAPSVISVTSGVKPPTFRKVSVCWTAVTSLTFDLIRTFVKLFYTASKKNTSSQVDLMSISKESHPTYSKRLEKAIEINTIILLHNIPDVKEQTGKCNLYVTLP